ncbi:hypothetical protein PP175_29090 (plasmid) [Aneurinibacillus sp. Ricciae_BoGa-3]|uniref:hypothetical protein n=1 Tax=Aneurinibacillus sp. Ricciae_BoGa-3 TaxID=3022697 RepID=UPI002340489A|nr:hypothetical protein [Aneurinibacillus sp. Ricciae_BoGa-3]WCK57248.1 hypothetical protein PP175_29090 [Aneurinibacillus sp. Ricciae_BoGa-3]
MWKMVWFEENEEMSMSINGSLVDVETELIRLEDNGINTNQVKVFTPQGVKLSYLEAMTLLVSSSIASEVH